MVEWSQTDHGIHHSFKINNYDMVQASYSTGPENTAGKMGKGMAQLLLNAIAHFLSICDCNRIIAHHRLIELKRRCGGQLSYDGAFSKPYQK